MYNYTFTLFPAAVPEIHQVNNIKLVGHVNKKKCLFSNNAA